MVFDSASSIASTTRGPNPDYPAGTWSAFSLLFVLTIIIVYLLIFQTTDVDAWGSDGHEIIANIAYSRLSREARAAVNTILIGSQFLKGPINTNKSRMRIKSASSSNSPLADVADWADKVRYTHEWHWTAPLHYIDVEDKTYKHGCHYMNSSTAKGNEESCQFIYERDCKHDFCVAGAISNYSNILYEESQILLESRVNPKYERRLRGLQMKFGNMIATDNSTALVLDSLMFVTHFIGDIHQPLHCSRKSDKGGNSFHVEFVVPSEKSHQWNLHSVWDTGIILRSVEEMYSKSRDEFENNIKEMIETDYASEIRNWLECGDGRKQKCTTLWGEESFSDALQYAYLSEMGEEIISGATISDKYYHSRLLIIQKRLAMAGVRLAYSLEVILGVGHI